MGDRRGSSPRWPRPYMIESVLYLFIWSIPHMRVSFRLFSVDIKDYCCGQKKNKSRCWDGVLFLFPCLSFKKIGFIYHSQIAACFFGCLDFLSLHYIVLQEYIPDLHSIIAEHFYFFFFSTAS
ncbi:hypothetical protein ABW19_dt0209157 [Dactylella cylindrospora]|nr:hypothetical protein ABW19_dt0209157 [Dactylella cylindrospora]